ncbi:MAG TPA: hypothetical protein VKC57_18025, partial [Ktedonobacterales bacterium]|nr:hypothetical protein [Ktedonobacterales bacterium]
TLPIAWRYRMGSWLTPFLSGPNRKMAWLCQQALRYDPYHEQWEKRLARYFVFHLRINVNTGASSIKRNIKALLQDLSLEANERYPEKTRQRFQSAMDQLVTDGVIDGWEYAKNNATLPARKWLATWLSWDVQVHAGPLMTERHAPQIESAKQRREKPAKPDAKRGGKT